MHPEHNKGIKHRADIIDYIYICMYNVLIRIMYVPESVYIHIYIYIYVKPVLCKYVHVRM